MAFGCGTGAARDPGPPSAAGGCPARSDRRGGSGAAGADLVDDPGVLEGQLAPALVPSADPAVAGGHLRLEQDGPVDAVGRDVAQRGHPLRRLDVASEFESLHLEKWLADSRLHQRSFNLIELDRLFN